MGEVYSKVGIISCSGEEIPEGTIARQAVRRVLEGLRPQQTVTLCLPLFLAGEEGERRFAREHPTITVDAARSSAQSRGTEKYSGKVNASLIVRDILGDSAKGCYRSTRHADQADEKAVWLVAERIASEVDALAGSVRMELDNATADDGACCACSKPSQEGMLENQGQFGRHRRSAVDFRATSQEGPGASDMIALDTLLKTVSVYHFIDAHEEADYRDALATAYRTYCERNV